MKDSRIPGFYRMTIAERIDALLREQWLDAGLARHLKERVVLLDTHGANRMIENVIGVFGLPLAVAPNFVINGRDCVVPMVVEEPSIVAGVSNAAKLARAGGGFRVQAGDRLLIGQILLVDVANADAAMRTLRDAHVDLLALANEHEHRLLARGGGARAIEVFRHTLPDGQDAIALHLLVDTCDAMGANLVNSMCERIAPAVGKCVSGRAVLRILSNLADRALVTANVTLPLAVLAVESRKTVALRDDIVLANDLANADPYRAATHNKGIMNGIDAVAIATGNDWRSLEAGAHAYAARSGAYRSLTRWQVDADGNLEGQLVMPIKVGTVGGALHSNPAASAGLAIAGVQSASELAEMMGAVGLAQNLAALRALVSDGIQKAHMSLHARSVAASVGAPPESFERVVDALIESGDIKDWKAREVLQQLHDDEYCASYSMRAQGSAAGKVILFGEHAAVYDRHVLALPIERAALASVSEVNCETTLTVREPARTRRFAVLPSASAGVAGMLAFIIDRLGLANRCYEVHLQLRVPAAMGLGSSASAAVAIVRAFDSAFTLGLDDAAVNSLAFDCEKLAHGDPSGIDNTLATYGTPVLFRRNATPQVRQIAVVERPPLVIAASGKRGITRDQVAAVRQRFERSRGPYDALFDQMDAISLAGADALVKGDYATLGSLMNVCHGLLNALQVSTPELEKMVDIARSRGATGAKLTGSGGGGSIVALCPGTVAEVEQALDRAGYRIVRMEAE
ncbi:MAG: hydroxymethylglutaryl-CoA reductase, degradative [Woeseia sp.]